MPIIPNIGDFTIIITFFIILFSAIVIDIVTLFIAFAVKIYRKIFGIKRILPKKEYGVSIIIPAYNEEKNIYKVISHAFNQTHPPKEVIVVDDNSTDNTIKECLRAKRDFKNLKIISREKNRGKAKNITFILKKVHLEEITLILDADTFISRKYIETILKPFPNRRVVIATGTSLPINHGGFWGKVIFHGAVFTYKFYCFRKRAQSYRNAVSVVTGDSAAYRTSFLKEVGGLPVGTQTEDLDITWIALEKGYRVVYQQDAMAESKDASTLKGHWSQITRWYAGSFQALIKHKTDLFKAKPLLFTTLIPSFFDSFTYSASILFIGFFFFFFPQLAIAFFLADLIFTLLAIIYLDWKSIIYLPHIYFVKVIWSAAYLYAALKTGIEFLIGRRSWEGTWKRTGFYKA